MVLSDTSGYSLNLQATWLALLQIFFLSIRSAFSHGFGLRGYNLISEYNWITTHWQATWLACQSWKSQPLFGYKGWLSTLRQSVVWALVSGCNWNFYMHFYCFPSTCTFNQFLFALQACLPAFAFRGTSPKRVIVLTVPSTCTFNQFLFALQACLPASAFRGTFPKHEIVFVSSILYF